MVNLHLYISLGQRQEYKLSFVTETLFLLRSFVISFIKKERKAFKLCDFRLKMFSVLRVKNIGHLQKETITGDKNDVASKHSC